ncbi:MAG: right-handed parallel beta-helix repeat-containing protein [Candidatus Cloacimonetes bacterium]|nr:right-handed parallel beta-helix repeat-containing protein [Candidatus Cloacimonadota bacterium]
MNLFSHLTITGESEDNVIIDAEETSRVITVFLCENLVISNLTVSNGFTPFNIVLRGEGGGIYSRLSEITLNNVTITGNYAEYFGGGVYIDDSEVSMDNVEVTDNMSSYWGGGIYMEEYICTIIDSRISGNTSGGGGGIYFEPFNYNDEVYLEGVDFIENNADFGGGFYYSGDYEWDPVFNMSTENRCNIYSNNTINRGQGSDIYSSSNLEVIVDTFTVLNPTDFHTYPVYRFDFDILHGLYEQVSADLYVSPAGSNDNGGLTSEDPLQTIQYACMSIIATEDEPRTIYLAEGTYSPSLTGEYYPVSLPEYVSLIGEDMDTVILDAESTSGVMSLYECNNATVSNITLTNGSSTGLYCNDCDSTYFENLKIYNNNTEGSGGGLKLKDCRKPYLKNLEIFNNSAVYSGGGIYCEGSPVLENILIYGNTADYCGGGICFEIDSEPVLRNVTICDNTAAINGGGIYNNTGFANYPCLVNCILRNNMPQEIFLSDTGGNMSHIFIAYSDIQGGYDNIGFSGNFNPASIYWHTSNINTDPLFTDPAGGNYELTPYSLCIDAGTAFFEYDDLIWIDLEDNEYYGIAPDMGAFEYEGEFLVSYGDIDNNLTVESYDVSLLLQYLVGFDPLPEDPVPWNEWRLQRADVDLDGNIYAIDGSYILQYIVGILEGLPVRNSIRATENLIKITSDEEYLYLSSEKEILSLSYQIIDYDNLKLGKEEVLQENCLYFENEGKFALATAISKSGNILRIPYERKADFGCSLTLEIEGNGYLDQISYTFGDPVPESTQFNAIYPNPFNPETTIAYQLAEAGKIKIDVYNIKGQKVTTLLNEDRKAGFHTLTWDASQYNSGVYFIRLTSGNYQKINKVVLLK